MDEGGAVELATRSSGAAALPRGRSRDEVRAALEALRQGDADWHAGRTFSLVYHAGDEVVSVLRDAVSLFVMENALSPLAFPSLRALENDVLGIALGLLHAPPGAAGSMTTGGTESILMAVRTAREWGRSVRGIAEPKVLVPVTAHPAFQKAAHYLDVEVVPVPTGPDFTASVEAARALMDERTVLVVASAPAYPQGVLDPVADLAALARERGVLCHVDACLGGFLLPFIERLGQPLPPFDFRVDGVTSISADLHKYGYAAKGASVVLYRDADLRRHQFFTHTEWPGGLYVSPTMTGTRSGAAIAAAWAVLHFLGEEGYLDLAHRVLGTTRRLREGIEAIPGLHVLGEPAMSVLSFASDRHDVHALAPALERRGWRVDLNQRPASIHLMVTPAHEQHADEFLADLRAAASEPPSDPSGNAAVYGMLATTPDRASVGEFLKGILDGIYTPGAAR
jgi:glutamate/tyrosine decarboxylase-like PLP-dependent enzyme